MGALLAHETGWRSFARILCRAMLVVVLLEPLVGEGERVPSRLVKAAERLVDSRGGEELELLNGVTGLVLRGKISIVAGSQPINGLSTN
jgi:hypothetical protein